MAYNLYEIAGKPEGLTAKERLSNFEEYYLRKLGNEMRASLRKSQYFWLYGAFCWFTDETQTKVQKVYLLENDVCIFADGDTHYKVELYGFDC